MTRLRSAIRLGALLGALLAAGCGGGDADPTPAPTPATYPASGHYSWVLKAEGPTDSLKFGLSLLHPLDTQTEYVIEPASAAVTDARLVASGSVDATASRTGVLQPHALLYVVGGDVRYVPLRADGQAPASRVLRAHSTSACRIVIEAVDYAAPEHSRHVVSTAGPDGVCDTADDARAEVRLDPTAGLVLAPFAAAAPLAALRDPATLAPTAWLLPTRVRLWAATATQPAEFRDAADPVTAVVQGTAHGALVESARGLSRIDVDAAGQVVETPLPALAGTGWQGLGHDASHYYAWRNAADATWSVQRIARSGSTATTLASGAGSVSLASMGREVLFATVVDGMATTLWRLPKAVPGGAQVLRSGPYPSTAAAVLTGASGVHLLSVATGLGRNGASYGVEFIDETGTVLYRSGAGGLSLTPVAAERIDFGSSENRTRFLYLEGFGDRFFGDAVIWCYDSGAGTATRIGALAGRAEFGDDAVFANVVAGPLGPAAGYASRSIGGVLQGAGTRVFSFDPGQAESLRTATTRR